tara:strand:+ start:14835 stop:15059 length:225 start_codon:yes stop_codon:yes gene_type:complete
MWPAAILPDTRHVFSQSLTRLLETEMNDFHFTEDDYDVLDQVADEFDLFDDLPFDPSDEPSDEALQRIETEAVR